MPFLKPEVIFTILILVLPGVLSQIVFNSLVSSTDKERRIDVYHGILHSVFIYIILYPVMVVIIGLFSKGEESKTVTAITERSLTALTTGSIWAPLVTVLVLVIASICWGFIYSNIYRSKLINKFLGKYAEAVEPPNIYAALLDNGFIQNDYKRGFWITAKVDDNKYVEGYVEMAAVTDSPREVFLKEVVYLDSQKNEINRLHQNTGIILNIDKHSIVEFTEVTL